MNAPLSILVVEDDTTNRAIIDISLRLDSQITVHTVDSGWDALVAATTRSIPFDVMLLDGLLSDMSALTLMKYLADSEKPTDFPIIILTALVSQADADGFRNAGAIAVIHKPFDPITLAETVRASITRR